MVLSDWGRVRLATTRLTLVLEEEISLAMKLLGVSKVEDLGPEYLDLSRINT